MKSLIIANLVLLTGVATGCTQHRVTVDPIYATIDINIKIDNRLDEFYAFEDELEEELDEEPEESSSSTGIVTGETGVES